MNRYIAGVALMLLGACSATQQQLTVTDTCATNAAVVSALADVAKKGELSSKQIALVGKDIAATDPVCSASAPGTALNAAALSAAQELATVLASVKEGN